MISTQSIRHEMTTAQRDRILARAARLRTWAEGRRWQRAAFSFQTDSEKRFIAVALRLERLVRKDNDIAGCVGQATERHIAGETSYVEWVDELRWCGLNAQAGHTKLTPEQAARRQANLDRLYPRLVWEVADHATE